MACEVLALLCVCVVANTLTYLTVVSPSTPPALLPLLEPSTLLTAQTATKSLILNTPHLLLDASFEEVTTAWLSAFCEETQVPLLVLGPVTKVQSGNWTFYLGGTHEEVASALDEALGCLGVKKVTLLSDSSVNSQTLQRTVSAAPRKVRYEHHLFATAESPQTFVGKILRPTGNRVTVFITSAAATKELLKGQYHMHIGGRGYANLILQSSALFSRTGNDNEANLAEGELLLAEEADSLAVFEQDLYARRYELVKSFLFSSPGQVKTLLDRQFPAQVRSPRYVLVNLHNSTRSVVLRLYSNNCSFTGPIYFLGNTLSLPTNYSAPIPVSANFGQRDPSGMYLEVVAETSASVLAFEEINHRQEMLPNFEIELWNFTGGITRFNASQFGATVMPYRDRFGAALLPSMTSLNTIAMLKYLRSNNINVPFVGAITNDDFLSSPSDVPGFVRVIIPNIYMQIVLVQTLKKLGWTSCSLLVMDSLMGLSIQRNLQRLLAQSGISVVNDPEYQVISASVTTLEEARANFTAGFRHIIKTRCRIVIVVTAMMSSFVPIVFYELGMRRGDLVLFGTTVFVTPRLFEGWNETKTAQGMEVMHGSLQLLPEVLIGPVGSTFLSSYAKRFSFKPSFSFACAYYDAAYTIGHALQWLLVTGKDFLNATDMSKSLHGVRFTGCSGLVYFTTYSNDRQGMTVSLNTLTTNGTIPIERSIGWFDPTGVVLLKMDPTFLWGDGTTRIPSTFRELILRCPFEKRYSQDFSEGQDAFLGVCLAVFALATALGVAMYWGFRVPLFILRDKHELEVEDALIMIGLLVEFCQCLRLIGNFAFVSVGLQRILDVCIGNIGGLRDLTDGGFTHLWLVAEGLAGGWVLAVVLLHGLPHWVLGEGILRVLLEVGAIGFAQWAFVPELFILLGSFECTKGTAEVDSSPVFASSFLKVDCHLPCWEGLHICIAVLSALTLLALLVGLGLYRLRWQATRPLLHIHASVFFLQIKACYQVLQVVLLRVSQNAVLQSLLMLGTRVLYIALLLVKRSYGYSRMRLWHFASEVALVWASELIFWHERGGSDLIVGVLIGVGWLCIAAIAFGYQLWRAPSLLYRPKGINTVPLYKFAFQPVTTEIAHALQMEFDQTNKHCTIKTALYTANMPTFTEGTQLRRPVESENSQMQQGS